MLKVIAWNIARRAEAWRLLAHTGADIALLQEANAPPADVTAKVSADPAPWKIGTRKRWRTAVAKLSDRVQVTWLDAKPLAEARGDELRVSRRRTLAAAAITPASGEPFIAVSVYGTWEKPHSMIKRDFIYADASVHRLISDLSVFAGKRIPPKHSDRGRSQRPPRIWRTGRSLLGRCLAYRGRSWRRSEAPD